MYSHATKQQTGDTYSDSPSCARTANTPKIQTKLTVNAPGDHHEQEADAMADRVMRMPSSSSWLQRKYAAGGQEEENHHAQRKQGSNTVTPYLQAKGGDGGMASDTVSQGITASQGRGSRMDDNTLDFMSSRFGADFSQVNIHTGGNAEQLSEELNARAFTTGNNIYFNKGEYNPGTAAGQRLLAHELTHVLQQSGNNGAVQRDDKKDPDAAEAITLERDILASAAYKGLEADSQSRVNQIIAIAKTKPPGQNKGQRNYYFKKLQIALTTPFNGKESGKTEYDCSDNAEKENKKAVDEALKIENEQWKGFLWNMEENLVAERKDKMVTRAGKGGKLYRVDATNLRSIRVLIKVRLIGADGEVRKIKALEDAIEREVWKSTRGYYLDIEFVDAPGNDVFDMTVKFCQWANAGNWASKPVTLSHEVHHALGLTDRYDYIESHSKNKDMNVAMRLVWFLAQMNKATSDRDKFSKMATSSNPLLAEDVCNVAFADAAERKKCIDARKDMDPSNVPPI